MKTETNLAIIGYGYMGNIYKKACFELYDRKNVELYYKYDLPGMLEDFCLKAIVDTAFNESVYNPEEDIWYYHSIEELLNSRDLAIDAAIVSTPIKTHFNIASKLIKHRISLLIEKPVCETAKEVRELIRLARKNKVRLMPGHVERYNPVTIDATEAVKFKVYGKVKEYTFTRESAKPQRVKDNIIIDKLIHDLDLAECIFGKYRITDVQARKNNGEIMECIITTRHREGYRGRIVSSWLVKNKKRELIINFERGILECDLIEKRINVMRLNEFSKKISGYKNNQIKDQLVDFIAYKNKYIKTLVTMKNALNAAFTIDKIIRRVDNEF